MRGMWRLIRYFLGRDLIPSLISWVGLVRVGYQGCDTVGGPSHGTVFQFWRLINLPSLVNLNP